MDIIRAWKDEEYRLSLTEEQRALLPDSPAGLMELSDAELASIVGGSGRKKDDDLISASASVSVTVGTL